VDGTKVLRHQCDRARGCVLDSARLEYSLADYACVADLHELGGEGSVALVMSNPKPPNHWAQNNASYSI
jgi:hypothetical protein